MKTANPRIKKMHLPKGRLPLSFFEGLPKGAILKLYYWCGNRGSFLWKHERVEGCRVVGAFKYEDEMDKWSDVGDYLYVCGRFVCQGSSADPVHAWAPKVRDTSNV